MFRRRSFFQGRAIRGAGLQEIRWLHVGGSDMTEQQWRESFARSFGAYLSGRAVNEVDRRGRPITDSDFLLYLNAHHEEIPFRIPPEPRDARWQLRIDTTRRHGFVDGGAPHEPGATLRVAGRAIAVLEFPLRPARH